MRILRLTLRDDRGLALPIVLMLTVVMMIAITAGLTTATSGLRQAATDQDRTAAYDAAYAGVQDYLIRINADGSYGQYGNSSAAFSSGSTLTSPTVTNYAFATAQGGDWAAVQTGGVSARCTGTTVPCFRYEVDNRQLSASGIVRLRSTGRMDGATRSIIVNIKRKGFVNYLYFTDYETQDPQISGKSYCEAYAWEANSTRTDDCTIQFAKTDLLSGAVHSNDTIAVCGATFNQPVTTANPNTPNYRIMSGCTDGVWNAGKPKSVSKIEMPDTNSAMRAQTRSDLVPTPGCLYTGPTVVQYLGDGRMTVWSPWTKYTNITSSSTTGSNPTRCGRPGTDAGSLGSSSGATVPELATNLLYVQTVPTGADPNTTSTTSIPDGMKCVGSNGSSNVSDAAASVGWKFGPWSFPMPSEAAPDGWDGGPGLTTSGGTWTPGTWSTTRPAYNCRAGDLYVEGTVTTQTTAASDDYVYVIGDLKYADSSRDVLGLVGNNAVLVWNPVNNTGANLLSSDTDRTVDAAVLSVAHTFQVQNFNLGSSRGTLTVLGSIAQKFRGPVATSSGGSLKTGYRKDYQYDPLLATVTPPYFLSPSSTVFAPSLYMGTTPAYASTGQAQP